MVISTILWTTQGHKLKWSTKDPIHKEFQFINVYPYKERSNLCSNILFRKVQMSANTQKRSPTSISYGSLLDLHYGLLSTPIQ